MKALTFSLASSFAGLLLLAAPLSQAASSKTLCVLNFERKAHLFTHLIDRVYSGLTNVRRVHEAVPSDFLRCIEDDFEEIIIIAHAFQMDDEGTRFTLGYFKSKSPSARAEELSRLRSELTCAIEKEAPLRVYDEWSPDSLGPTARYRNLVNALDRLDQLTPDQPIYEHLPILPRIFEKADRLLLHRRQHGQDNKLKTIRMSTCVPDLILATYPDLRSLVEHHGIDLIHGPRARLASLIQGRTVSTVTRSWLQQALK